MSQSVWPYDHARQDSYGADKALGELWCFVICPANPLGYWDDWCPLCIDAIDARTF
jgi:hypothetical protein